MQLPVMANGKNSGLTAGTGCRTQPANRNPFSRLALRAVAAALFCAGVAANAHAQCATPAGRGPALLPDLKAIFQQKSEARPAQRAVRKPGSASIVGLWSVTVIFDGETIDVAFEVWHDDGTEILNDYTNPIEGNVCLGVWESSDGNTYKLKHPFWTFDGSGNLTGSGVIRETVTVAGDQNSFSGPASVDYYDLNGNHIGHYFDFVKGTRITAD